LLRLKNLQQLDMTPEEVSYLRQRTRGNSYLVITDFEELFLKNNTSSDIFLYDKDVITIPEKINTVFVSGGVYNPGNYAYQPEWNFEQYITVAGGYTDLARESWTRIIDVQTGKWLEAETDIEIKEGDMIFVPERDPVDWYQKFIEGLTVVSQVAAIVLIVITVSK